MLLRFSDTAQIKEDEQTRIKSVLADYLHHLKEVSNSQKYDQDESSLHLPFDEVLVKESLDAFEKAGKESVKDFVLIGIGGSSLGAKALIKALGGKSQVKFHFMENIEGPLPELNAHPEDTLVNFISKSGTTYEPTVNLKKLLEAYPKLKKRTVVTTSNPEKIPDLGITPLHTLLVPPKVGGRYSVFSPVGIFPLLFSGLNIFDLLEGAMGAVKEGTTGDVLRNPALFSAALKFDNFQKGRTIDISFYFHPQLENLGKWWRQLTAESLGKQGKGLTPVVSIGTQDLHSMLQLYLEGPRDKFTEFVFADNQVLPDVKTILQGVKASYIEHGQPFIELDLQSLSEKALGYYMQTKMIETMLLGNLMKVNAFDQPAVEGYKRLAALAV